VSRKKVSLAVEAVLADMEWVASTLPDPLDVIDRCTNTIILHWAELSEGERRELVEVAHENFEIALDVGQGRPVVAA
jgi:hypothetical protein